MLIGRRIFGGKHYNQTKETLVDLQATNEMAAWIFRQEAMVALS
jgi:hypothetical protein